MAKRCARDSGWCNGAICRELGVDCLNSDHVRAVTRVAESRGCVGPYPCGRAIPEFGGRDAACDCEQEVLEGPWEDEDPRHYAYRMGDQDA